MNPEVIRHSEAIDLVSTTTIQGVLYGIGFILYCMCQRLLYKDFRKGDKPRHTILLFLHSFLVFVVASMVLVILTQTALLAYLDHNDSVGSPILYEKGLLPVKPPSTYKLLNIVIGPLICFLVDAAEIWRIFIIWSESPYRVHAVVVSVLCSLANPSMSISAYLLFAAMVMWDVSAFFIYSAIALSSPTNTSSNIQIIVCNGIETITILIYFLLIAGRIIFVRRRIAKMMGETFSSLSNGYTSVVAILAESYALAAVVSLGATISSAAFDVRRPALFFFRAISPHVNMISYLLVLYRVLSGRAWNRDTERQLTTLRWNYQDTNTTTRISQIPHNSNVIGSLPLNGSLA
ncbi:hypothetical protein D9756_001992 [Leucocoprinus leucothites]|uniref:Uncharacterized protein n=1 Tax=Leucocoprinus leucothites TaxID=201217 RepID=A0A8H5LM59_9AGAR|nr:hypothetical protein D9756_001992 [Leucoagaricus leucothites]